MTTIGARELAKVDGGVAPRYETDEEGVTWMITCTGARIRISF